MTNRQQINYKDIQCFFGCCENTAFNYMKRAKRNYGKKKGQPLLIYEFCAHFDIDENYFREKIGLPIQ